MLVQHISSVQGGADSLPADDATCLLTADSVLWRLRCVLVVYKDFSEQKVILHIGKLNYFYWQTIKDDITFFE